MYYFGIFFSIFAFFLTSCGVLLSEKNQNKDASYQDLSLPKSRPNHSKDIALDIWSIDFIENTEFQNKCIENNKALKNWIYKNLKNIDGENILQISLDKKSSCSTSKYKIDDKISNMRYVINFCFAEKNNSIHCIVTDVSNFRIYSHHISPRYEKIIIEKQRDELIMLLERDFSMQMNEKLRILEKNTMQ